MARAANLEKQLGAIATELKNAMDCLSTLSAVRSKNLKSAAIELRAKDEEATLRLAAAEVKLAAVADAKRRMEARGDFDHEACVQKLMDDDSTSTFLSCPDDGEDDAMLLELLEQLSQLEVSLRKD